MSNPAAPTETPAAEATDYVGMPPETYTAPAPRTPRAGAESPTPVQGVTVNAYSIISLVAGVFGFTFVGAIIAVVFGHLAFKQIGNGSKERGKAFALAGLILGYASIVAALATVAIVAILGLIAYSLAS